MQCPNCGHWNEAGSRFCEECGLELPQESSAPAYSVPVRPATSQDSAPAVPAVPAVPDQPLVPVADAVPVAYAGPHLVLKSTGSIFKLGSAAVIGRENPALQIDLEGYPDGQYISHRHAQVVKMDDKFYVEDLGSANHTWVNEIKLAQGQQEPLKDGDTIKLGKIELTFHET